MGRGGAGARARAKAGGGGGGPAVAERPAPFGEARSREEAVAQAARLGVRLEVGAVALERANYVVEALADLRARGFALPSAVEVHAAAAPPHGSAVGLFFGGRDRIGVYGTSTRAREALDAAAEARAGLFASASPRHTIRHEVGHALHFAKVGGRRYQELHGESELGRFRRIAEPATRGISRYARTNPAEFVAEVFTRILDGKRVNRHQFRLYKEYGGPLPSDRRRGLGRPRG